MPDSVLEYILTSFLHVEDLSIHFTIKEMAFMKQEYKHFVNNSANFSLDKFFMTAG